MLTNWVVWGKVFMDKERLCDLYLILTKQYFPSLLCRVLGWFAFEISKVFFYIFLSVREQSWRLCDFFAWSCFERSWLLAVKICYDSIRKKVIYKKHSNLLMKPYIWGKATCYYWMHKKGMAIPPPGLRVFFAVIFLHFFW